MGELFWALLTVSAAVLEIIIPGLVTIWFACSGILMVFLTGVVKNPVTEFFIFSVISILLVVFTRPALKKWLEKGKVKAYEGEGSETVIENITEYGKYEVKFKGVLWTAISPYIFVKGEKVIIDGFEGNKIILRKKEED